MDDELHSTDREPEVRHAHRGENLRVPNAIEYLEDNDHPVDDSQCCPWCGNFKCCMPRGKTIATSRGLYCDEECYDKDRAYVRDLPATT
jgi:hypothetical protein